MNGREKFKRFVRIAIIVLACFGGIRYLISDICSNVHYSDGKLILGSQPDSVTEENLKIIRQQLPKFLNFLQNQVVSEVVSETAEEVFEGSSSAD